MAYIQQWDSKKIVDSSLTVMEKRMRVATVFVQGEVKLAINVGNRKGKNPSAPGEPPRKVSGRLFNSIFAKVIRVINMVYGVVGTNVKYGRRLELGFVGRDAKGRNYHQAPRPFLVPAVRHNLQQIKDILGGK